MNKSFIIALVLLLSSFSAYSQSYLDDVMVEEQEYSKPLMIKIPISRMLESSSYLGLQMEQFINYKVAVQQSILFSNSAVSLIGWEEGISGFDQVSERSAWESNSMFKWYLNQKANFSDHVRTYVALNVFIGQEFISGEKVFGINCTNGWDCDYWQRLEVDMLKWRYGGGLSWGMLLDFHPFVVDINAGGLVSTFNQHYRNDISIDLNRVVEFHQEGYSSTEIVPRLTISVGYFLRY